MNDATYYCGRALISIDFPESRFLIFVTDSNANMDLITIKKYIERGDYLRNKCKNINLPESPTPTYQILTNENLISFLPEIKYKKRITREILNLLHDNNVWGRKYTEDKEYKEYIELVVENKDVKNRKYYFTISLNDYPFSPPEIRINDTSINYLDWNLSTTFSTILNFLKDIEVKPEVKPLTFPKFDSKICWIL